MFLVAINHSWALPTGHRCETVTQICERLDGLPLAIELAPARVGVLAEEEILSQLNDRFRLLKGGSRTAPRRLQTMSAAIDWSYRLLTEDEARIFRRLSVFRGGFTLESVQAICVEKTTASVLDLIAALVQKSMVVAERTEGSGSRYRLPESQLAYAEDRLHEADELGALRQHHLPYRH
jgi:predicted ATPase